jgi:hypothetical protein
MGFSFLLRMPTEARNIGDQRCVFFIYLLEQAVTPCYLAKLGVLRHGVYHCKWWDQ